jgi:threonine/homoserine/homoserine lactone efflux protein
MTFALMALTIAAVTFAYGLIAVLLTHYLARRLRANPLISVFFQKLAGLFLIAFGIRLVVTR